MDTPSQAAAIQSVCSTPIHCATGPASAIPIGSGANTEIRSKLDTRASASRGTRSCRVVSHSTM